MLPHFPVLFVSYFIGIKVFIVTIIIINSLIFQMLFVVPD